MRSEMLQNELIFHNDSILLRAADLAEIGIENVVDDHWKVDSACGRVGRRPLCRIEGRLVHEGGPDSSEDVVEFDRQIHRGSLCKS